MKHLLIIGLFFCFSSGLLAQEADSVEAPVHELDKRGGFQDIKLYSSVEDYPGLEMKKEIKDDEMFPGAMLYQNKNGFYESIGDVKVYSVDVKTYKGTIYEIIVVTEKSPKIYQGLSKAFGKSNYHISEKGYYWRTKEIRLFFKQEGKKKLKLEYFSYTMQRDRKEEIRKSYTDVSDDF